MSPLVRLLGALALALCACKSAAPAPAASPSPQVAPHDAPEGGNRDAHGPPDVDAYVARLESPERVADLQPALVIEKLALAPEARVCDLGCGPGVFALAFARALPRGVVYAVDIEPRQLDRLSEHLLEQHLDNVVPVLASPTTPHMPPASVDLIFIGDTYHHLEDRVAYMRRLARALKPGGRLALLEYKPGPLPVGPPPEHKLPPGVLAEELTAAGYELVADYPTHANHDFQVWRVRP